MQIVDIYIQLQDEGTDVWRPVKGEHIGNSQYKILSMNDSQGDEIWEHSAGDIVQCEKVLQNGQTFLRVLSKNHS